MEQNGLCWGDNRAIARFHICGKFPVVVMSKGVERAAKPRSLRDTTALDTSALVARWINEATGNLIRTRGPRRLPRTGEGIGKESGGAQ